jgi:hypothetical protein
MHMTSGTLAERLAQEHQLSPREAVRIGASLAREVERMHRQGRRPVSIAPASVVLRGNDVMLGEDELVGFPAPEEVNGHPADERTDVYRLGVVMYLMLTGNPPPAPLAASKITTSARLRPPTPPPSVHAVRRDVARALDAAITRALAWDPRDRYARAIHFAEVLDQSLTQRLADEPHSDRPSQMMIVDSWEFQEEEKRAERRSKRQLTERRAIALLVVLSVVLGGVLLLR